MKIAAPISRVEEIAELAEAGADEFYCGAVPEDWLARFGTGNVNRRLFGNLRGNGELERAARAAADCQRPLSLALNAQHYADAHLAPLTELARDFAAMGGSALIVGDLGLLAHLASCDLGLRLHLSSVASCRNSEAARFAGELGADRVILPRDVSVGEIARVCRALPGTEIEAFVLNDGCVFEEGVCHTIHLPGKLGGPICLDRFEQNTVRRDGAALGDDERQRLQENDAAWRQWLWYRMGCGFTVAANGLPWGPCGLCALAELDAAGVASVKVAGREAPTERKRQSVALVRAVRDRLRAGDEPTSVAAFARGARGEPKHCDVGYMCYYPPQRVATADDAAP